MEQNIQYDFCPKCGALMRQGVCQSCEFTVNVNPNITNVSYQEQVNNPYGNTMGIGMPQPKPQPPKKKNTGLIVGLVIGGVCLVLIIVVVALITLYIIFNMVNIPESEDITTPLEEYDSFEYDYGNDEEPDTDINIAPDLDSPLIGEETWDDIWDNWEDNIEESERIDLDGDGVGDLEYESGVAGLNAEYYPVITDYIRYDLSYSVSFEKYENDEKSVDCTYPVLEGEYEFIPALNQFFFMFAQETESIADENACNAKSDAYVTYMDEEVMSVVFVEVYSFADDSTYECVYCYNIDIQKGEWINFELLDSSDEVLNELEKRCREQSTSDADYLFTEYSKDDIREFLTNVDDSLVAFYTPLGMEIGLCYEGYWCCATFKDYEKYITDVTYEDMKEF